MKGETRRLPDLPALTLIETPHDFATGNAVDQVYAAVWADPSQ